jgi:hypothetical protein
VSRAYIDDKSDGNITRAPLLLSRLFIHNIREGDHEPFSHCDVCWGNNRRSGINVGVGMALPGQQSQRSGGHRLRRHTGKSPVNLNAPVHTPRRWGWLPNRMVPAVLAFSLSHAGSARRLLVGTPPSRPPGRGCAVVGLALGFLLRSSPRQTCGAFVRPHARTNPTKARKTREATDSIVDFPTRGAGLTQDQWHKIKK